MKVLHVITGLDTGGAEVMLAKLVTSMDRERYSSQVVSLAPDLSLSDGIRAAGVQVTSLNLTPELRHGPLAVRRLMGVIRERQPDLIQTWMYHADLLAGIAARLCRVPVVWNIQSSTLDPAGIRRRTRAIARSCAVASRVVPRAIVSCSHAGADVHVSMGYARNRFRVIPNGTDLAIFKPDPETRKRVRAELGIPDEVRLIGMVARLHPQKDHANFFAAAGLLAKTHPQARFVLIGLGLDPGNEAIMRMVRAAGVEDRTDLLGLRSDIPRILCALDIHALSSSYGEGFPNVLGEAMAAGVPCVTTTIGDSGMIVGDTGRAVPSRDPEALAGAWRELLDLQREEFEDLRIRARKRVAEHFSLAASVAQYAALYEQIAGRAAAPAAVV